MTGYGRAQLQFGGRLISLEISSVNRRNLELSSSMPREWQSMERVIAERLSSRFARGKFHLQIQVKSGDSAKADWDVEGVKARYDALVEIAEACGQSLTADGSFWLRLAQDAQDNQDEQDWEDIWEQLEPVLDEALNALSEMRADEGTALAKDLRQRLEILEERQKEIAQLSASTVPNYRELLLERLKKAKLEIDLEDERVLKEIAIFSDRCDIEEELTRLSSHLQQFHRTLESTEPIGRKMDFLCQEINREVNTVGSKANNLEITRHVIECKNELERIREQVQNVE
ncbi:MAG: YicC/YloC family endoribonuclease [Verrucomicrobiota bacterium]